MKSKLVLFVCGVALGVTVTAVVVKGPLRDRPELINQKVSNGLAFLGSDNDALESALEEIEALKRENSELQSDVGEKGAEVLALQGELTERSAETREREQEREEWRDSMQDRMRKFSESRVESRIIGLSSAISMDPDQSEAVRIFLSQRAELEMRLRSGRYSGELSEAEQEALRSQLDEMSLGAHLQDVLSDEQYAEYESYRSEQNSVELESYASKELSRLVRGVRLTEDQMNLVFDKYYSLAQSSLRDGEIFNSRRYGGMESEEHLALVADVLDDGQMAALVQQLENNQRGNGGGRGARGGGPGGGGGGSR